MNYSLNTDTFNQQLLPPTKRKPKAKAWGRVLLNGLQWVRDRFFEDYVEGNTDVRVLNYDAGLTFNPPELVYYGGVVYECILASTGNLPTNPTYFSVKSFSVGDRINFIDKAVYECILLNTGGIGALNSIYWIKVQDIFLGIKERTKANSQVMLFEYMLNKYFGTDFNYPATTNDIYIAQYATQIQTFYMGRSGDNSSYMPRDSAYQFNYLSRNYLSPIVTHYAINVPAATYNSLASNDADRESIIRSFADKFNMAGIVYEVIKY